MSPRPGSDIAAVGAATEMVLTALATITDGDARAASSLPGWTRGHLLTHMARSGDGDRRCVDGAARDEVVQKYPDGMEGRARDIEAGAGRPARELLADVERSQRALDDAWRALPDDAWDRLGDTPMGLRTMVDVVRSRRRELLVHLVDLDIGVVPGDLPRDYLAADAEWIDEFRPTWVGS
jgi:maleylpyruvate isomerase